MMMTAEVEGTRESAGMTAKKKEDAVGLQVCHDSKCTLMYNYDDNGKVIKTETNMT